MGGPCSPWVTLEYVQESPNSDGLDDTLLSNMIDVAGELLYALSGRQYAGVCTDVVLPLRRWYDVEGDQNFPSSAYGWRSMWGVHSCGRPPERAGGCGPLSEITLGAYPVRQVTEVRIDGQVIDPTTYRVDDHRWLVRIDQTGPTSWPCCQSLDLNPLVDLDTFQVTFEWGMAPPVAGVEAARQLAIELAKGASGNPCNLPQRVLSLTVPGATYTMLDPLTFLDKGRTGLYFVDLFLRAVNPYGLARRSSVISPDIRRPVRRTSTIPGS